MADEIMHMSGSYNVRKPERTNMEPRVNAMVSRKAWEKNEEKIIDVFNKEQDLVLHRNTQKLYHPMGVQTCRIGYSN